MGDGAGLFCLTLHQILSNEPCARGGRFCSNPQANGVCEAGTENRTLCILSIICRYRNQLGMCHVAHVVGRGIHLGHFPAFGSVYGSSLAPTLCFEGRPTKPSLRSKGSRPALRVLLQTLRRFGSLASIGRLTHSALSQRHLICESEAAGVHHGQRLRVAKCACGHGKRLQTKWDTPPHVKRAGSRFVTHHQTVMQTGGPPNHKVYRPSDDAPPPSPPSSAQASAAGQHGH